MLTHSQIWRAIDALAARHGMSPSGLAKLAGLDPTTFNKSKRGAANGKLRWPSTESLSKVLAATGASLEDFVVLVTERRGAAHPHGAADRHGPGGRQRLFRRCRISGRAGLGRDRLSRNSPIRIATRWRSPAIPCCRSIAMATALWFRRPDRCGAATGWWSRPMAGEVMAKQLARMTAQRIELKSFNPGFRGTPFRAERNRVRAPDHLGQPVSGRYS